MMYCMDARRVNAPEINCVHQKFYESEIDIWRLLGQTWHIHNWNMHVASWT